MKNINKTEQKVTDGFYSGVVKGIKKRKYDYMVTFGLNLDHGEAEAILLLDMDIMDRKTAHFLILGIGGYDNFEEHLADCIGAEMAILVKRYACLKVLEVYPEEMLVVLKLNERNYLLHSTKQRERFMKNIRIGLSASYLGKSGEPLGYEEIFDDDFAKKLLEFKENGLPYKVPTNYYAEDSTPFSGDLF